MKCLPRADVRVATAVAENPDQGGAVREVQDREAARPARDAEHQRR